MAAAALLLVTGYWVGSVTGESTQTAEATQTTQALAGSDGERYLLVLFRSEEELANPAGEAKLVREYSAWAQDLAQQGHFLGGDPLSADGRLLIPMGTEVETRLQSSQGGEDPMTGYFLIAANDDDQAEEIARRCPHLRHGGKVMIRRLGH